MTTHPESLAEYDALMQERAVIEQMVADGELCAADGGECEFVEFSELYGADRDGNRGEWRTYVECRKCGEAP
jgi:hypothetical protein